MSRKSRLRTLFADWNTRAMFTCHDMTRLISQRQEAELPWTARWRMKLHFALCKWCRRYRRQLGLMRRAFTQLPQLEPEAPGDRLPAEARARLKKRLLGHEAP